MWQVITGFVVGIYVGTSYDCKPAIEFIKTWCKDKIPDEAIPKKKEE